MAAGRCNCGAVRFEVHGELRDVWNCHCHRCRRFTGHHMAASRADVDTVAIDDAGGLTWWQPDESARYGFCARCGSSLFYTAADRPQYLVICAGALDQPTGLRTTTAWWTAEHGDYHTRAAGLEEHPYDG